QGTTGHTGPSDQLAAVACASFTKRRIMSRAEYRVCRAVEAEIQRRRDGCRALSQTSLGEILSASTREAFFAINSKRVDILIINAFGEPIAAIEHQGGGHHQGSAVYRDAVKREALRKAGVEYIEVLDRHTPQDIAGMVRLLFRRERQVPRGDP